MPQLEEFEANRLATGGKTRFNNTSLILNLASRESEAAIHFSPELETVEILCCGRHSRLRCDV